MTSVQQQQQQQPGHVSPRRLAAQHVLQHFPASSPSPRPGKRRQQMITPTPSNRPSFPYNAPFQINELDKQLIKNVFTSQSTKGGHCLSTEARSNSVATTRSPEASAAEKNPGDSPIPSGGRNLPPTALISLIFPAFYKHRQQNHSTAARTARLRPSPASRNCGNSHRVCKVYWDLSSQPCWHQPKQDLLYPHTPPPSQKRRGIPDVALLVAGFWDFYSLMSGIALQGASSSAGISG